MGICMIFLTDFLRLIYLLINVVYTCMGVGYIHMCAGALRRHKRVKESLELELEAVVSHQRVHECCGPNSGPLEEQEVLLTTEPSVLHAGN